MYGFSKYEAQGRYDEWNTTQVKLKLNNKTDADILLGSGSRNTAGIPPYREPLNP